MHYIEWLSSSETVLPYHRSLVVIFRFDVITYAGAAILEFLFTLLSIDSQVLIE